MRAKASFYVDYFKEPIDRDYPGEVPYPFFQLSGQSPSQQPSEEYFLISRLPDFSALALGILEQLKRETSNNAYPYRIIFSENAFVQIGKTGKKVLEEIIVLHNDLVNPKRNS